MKAVWRLRIVLASLVTKGAITIPIRLLLAAMVALLFPATAPAQQQQQYVNILVNHSGEDRVGQAYAYELRELLRASSRYDLTASEDAAHLALHIVSMGVGNDNNGEASAIAATLTLAPSKSDTYLTTLVVLVGRERAKEMATSLLAAVDKHLDGLVRRTSTR